MGRSLGTFAAALGGPDHAGNRLDPLLHQAVEARQGPVEDLATQGFAALPGVGAARLLQVGGEVGQQGALQGHGPFTQPQHVGHMHKTGGAATDPVGIVVIEALHARNDEAAFGGMVGQVGRQQAPFPG